MPGRIHEEHYKMGMSKFAEGRSLREVLELALPKEGEFKTKEQDDQGFSLFVGFLEGAFKKLRRLR